MENETELQKFEIVLGNVASRIIFNDNGVVYQSIKDEIKWVGLRPRDWVGVISSIGNLLRLSDEEFKERTLENEVQSQDVMASMLISVLGNGEQ